MGQISFWTQRISILLCSFRTCYLSNAIVHLGKSVLLCCHCQLLCRCGGRLRRRTYRSGLNSPGLSPIPTRQQTWCVTTPNSSSPLPRYILQVPAISQHVPSETIRICLRQNVGLPHLPSEKPLGGFLIVPHTSFLREIHTWSTSINFWPG